MLLFLHRKSSTSSTSSISRLSFEELKDFVSQVQNLPCLIKEVNAIDKLMTQVESFRYEAKLLLTAEDYNESRVHELLEHAETLDLDLPEIPELKLVSFLPYFSVFLHKCFLKHLTCFRNGSQGNSYLKFQYNETEKWKYSTLKKDGTIIRT